MKMNSIEMDLLDKHKSNKKMIEKIMQDIENGLVTKPKFAEFKTQTT